MTRTTGKLSELERFKIVRKNFHKLAEISKDSKTQELRTFSN